MPQAEQRLSEAVIVVCDDFLCYVRLGQRLGEALLRLTAPAGKTVWLWELSGLL